MHLDWLARGSRRSLGSPTRGSARATGGRGIAAPAGPLHLLHKHRPVATSGGCADGGAPSTSNSVAPCGGCAAGGAPSTSRSVAPCGGGAAGGPPSTSAHGHRRRRQWAAQRQLLL